MAPLVLRVLISIIAVTILAAHLIWPDLKIDAISLALVVLCFLPWLHELFDSLEFPGGWKISFRKLESAAASIPEVDLDESPDPEAAPSYLAVRGLSPELGLVGLRIEIEKRLQQLADSHDLRHGRPKSANFLARELARAGVIPGEVAGALTEVVMAGNSAAHGAELPIRQADFAFDEGPRILAWLDAEIART